MDQYLPILLLIVLALAFAAGAFATSKMLGPGGRVSTLQSRGRTSPASPLAESFRPASPCGSTW